MISADVGLSAWLHKKYSILPFLLQGNWDSWIHRHVRLSGLHWKVIWLVFDLATICETVNSLNPEVGLSLFLPKILKKILNKISKKKGQKSRSDVLDSINPVRWIWPSGIQVRIYSKKIRLNFRFCALPKAGSKQKTSAIPSFSTLDRMEMFPVCFFVEIKKQNTSRNTFDRNKNKLSFLENVTSGFRNVRI